MGAVAWIEWEFFGEMAYLLGEPRSALTLAESAVSALVLPVEVFERFLAVDARASRRLVKLLSARLAETNKRAAQARDALCLDDETEEYKPEESLDFSCADARAPAKGGASLPPEGPLGGRS